MIKINTNKIFVDVRHLTLILFEKDEDDEMGDGAMVKNEILEPETTLEETDRDVDLAVYQCENCPRKFHRKRGLERHKQVWKQLINYLLIILSNY